MNILKSYDLLFCAWKSYSAMYMRATHPTRISSQAEKLDKKGLLAFRFPFGPRAKLNVSME